MKDKAFLITLDVNAARYSLADNGKIGKGRKNGGTE